MTDSPTYTFTAHTAAGRACEVLDLAMRMVFQAINDRDTGSLASDALDDATSSLAGILDELRSAIVLDECATADFDAAWETMRDRQDAMRGLEAM